MTSHMVPVYVTENQELAAKTSNCQQASQFRSVRDATIGQQVVISTPAIIYKRKNSQPRLLRLACECVGKQGELEDGLTTY